MISAYAMKGVAPKIGATPFFMMGAGHPYNYA